MADNQCEYMISENRRCSRNCPEGKSYCWQHENVVDELIKYNYTSSFMTFDHVFASKQTPMYELINMIGDKEGFAYPEWIISDRLLKNMRGYTWDDILNMSLKELKDSYADDYLIVKYAFNRPLSIEDGDPNDYNDFRHNIKG